MFLFVTNHCADSIGPCAFSDADKSRKVAETSNQERVRLRKTLKTTNISSSFGNTGFSLPLKSPRLRRKLLWKWDGNANRWILDVYGLSVNFFHTRKASTMHKKPSPSGHHWYLRCWSLVHRPVRCSLVMRVREIFWNRQCPRQIWCTLQPQIPPSFLLDITSLIPSKFAACSKILVR